MSNSILPTEGFLSKLLGKNTTQDNSLKDLLQSKQEADNLAKGVPSSGSDATETFSPSTRGAKAAAAIQQYQAAYQYSETMSINLKTRDGDEVTVDFRQLYAQYQSYKETQAAEEGPSGVRYFESKEALEATQFEEQFGFSVKGDLDEAELDAIFSVFEQVDELATNFFNGDIETAFQQAVEMEVDFSQLQSVDIDLQRTETVATSYQQAAAYKGIEQVGDEDTEQTQDPTVADLPPYLQKMQQAVAKLDEFFEESRAKVEELMANINAQRDAEGESTQSWLERIREFHNNLLERANLDKVTLKPSGVELDPLIQSTETASEETPEVTTTPEESSQKSIAE